MCVCVSRYRVQIACSACAPSLASPRQSTTAAPTTAIHQGGPRHDRLSACSSSGSHDVPTFTLLPDDPLMSFRKFSFFTGNSPPPRKVAVTPVTCTLICLAETSSAKTRLVGLLDSFGTSWWGSVSFLSSQQLRPNSTSEPGSSWPSLQLQMCLSQAATVTWRNL